MTVEEYDDSLGFDLTRYSLDMTVRDRKHHCRFWYEDGVWNGSVSGLPVAVYGKTLEDAIRHMRNALINYWNTVLNLWEVKEYDE